jgi:hypothetical protein
MARFGEAAHVSTRRFSDDYTAPDAAELVYEAVLAKAQREGKPETRDGADGYLAVFSLSGIVGELFPELHGRRRSDLTIALSKSGNVVMAVRSIPRSTYWVSAAMRNRETLRYVAKAGKLPGKSRVAVASQANVPEQTDTSSAVAAVTALVAENKRLRELLARIGELANG